MRHYATLFDKKYLPQGLALYQSLERHSREPFRLWILALDSETYEVLSRLQLSYAMVIPLDKFMNDLPALEAVRSNRTHQEFCWSLASQLCEYLLPQWPERNYWGLPEITYLDADLWFMADPTPVFADIGRRSIAITPHQFPENSEKPRLSKNGQFNVGFVHFKRSGAGMACLARWAAQVRERCSANVGCGDQVYLDSWESDFGNEVCVLGTGVNAGPWNLMAHEVTAHDGRVCLDGHPLVCYHFHEYDHGVRLTNYPLRPADIEVVYRPYVHACGQARERIAQLVATHAQ